MANRSNLWESKAWLKTEPNCIRIKHNHRHWLDLQHKTKQRVGSDLEWVWKRRWKTCWSEGIREYWAYLVVAQKNYGWERKQGRTFLDDSQITEQVHSKCCNQAKV